MLQSGSRGDEVKELQTQLNELGYDTGGIDGIYGGKTEAAVRAFQEAHGANPDGVAGQITQMRISAELKSRELKSDDGGMGPQ